MIEKQYTLYLENKLGVLAKLTKALAVAKVNIEGISVSESTDVALVQVIVSNSKAAKQVFDKAQISYTVQNVSVLPLQNKPGALAAVAAKLTKAGVNINYLYATACESSCASYAVISASDLKKVEAIWK